MIWMISRAKNIYANFLVPRHTYVESKKSELLLQEEVVAWSFLRGILHGVGLVDSWPEVVGVATEGDLQRLEEAVHSAEQRRRRARARLNGGLTVEDDHVIGEIGCHDEIVLNDEGGLLGVEDVALDDL